MKSEIILVPTGFPYILFRVESDILHKYVLAATDEQAIRLSHIAKAQAFPVSVQATIKDLGHSKTAKLLKQFGETWICKDDKFFFKRISNDSSFV